MTDYVISAVRYLDNNLKKGKELSSAQVHIFNNTSKKPFNTTPYEWTRQQVIGAMKLGKRFNTYYKCPKDRVYKLGSKIELYELNNELFIKTEKNDVECDNINELPLF